MSEKNQLYSSSSLLALFCCLSRCSLSFSELHQLKKDLEPFPIWKKSIKKLYLNRVGIYFGFPTWSTSSMDSTSGEPSVSGRRSASRPPKTEQPPMKRSGNSSKVKVGKYRAIWIWEKKVIQLKKKQKSLSPFSFTWGARIPPTLKWTKDNQLFAKRNLKKRIDHFKLPNLASVEHSPTAVLLISVGYSSEV